MFGISRVWAAIVHAHTHASTTGQGVDDHHAQNHAARHTTSGDLIASGTPDGTKFLRDDFSWQAAGGAHPDLATHDALGLATDAELTTHAGAADPHTGYLKEADFDDIDFLVGTATGHTAAEIVVGTSPGGELGGTWASPTVDATHSGSAHHSQTHDIDGADHNGFPGGTTTFLRADGTFAAPTAAAADPSYSPGSFTVATETGRYIPNHMKLTTTQRATLQGTGRLRLTN